MERRRRRRKIIGDKKNEYRGKKDYAEVEEYTIGTKSNI